MKMTDPIPAFSYLASQLKEKFPDLAYMHIIEPWIAGNVTINAIEGAPDSTDFLREIWEPGVFIAAGKFNRDTALHTADTKGGLIGFGRPFIANVSISVLFLQS
jgi:NADPH2 dehydrogenase